MIKKQRHTILRFACAEDTKFIRLAARPLDNIEELGGGRGGAALTTVEPTAGHPPVPPVEKSKSY